MRPASRGSIHPRNLRLASALTHQGREARDTSKHVRCSCLRGGGVMPLCKQPPRCGLSILSIEEKKPLSAAVISSAQEHTAGIADEGWSSMCV